MQEGEFLRQGIKLFAHLLSYWIAMLFNIIHASTPRLSKYSYIDVFWLMCLIMFLNL